MYICTGLRKIEKGVYICKELSWGFMFEENTLLAVRSDYVNADGQWNETFIKAHAEVRAKTCDIVTCLFTV